MQLVERDTFHICGWAVTTTAENNDRDISALYDDFFKTNKEALLRELSESQPGYFGLSWYTDDHHGYSYLLGIQVDADNELPTGSIIKSLAPTRWAVAGYHAGTNILEAWNEFFYTDIPCAGYAPNEAYNLYFEYYPGEVRGDYELWVPVVPSNT